MRIYSNKLTVAKVLHAFAAAREITSADIRAVDARSFTPRGTNNLWANGIEVYAESRHGNAATGHAPIGPGPRDHLPRAASWTGYGWVIAYLFAEDPDARIGFYDGVADFIAQVRASQAEHARHGGGYVDCRHDPGRLHPGEDNNPRTGIAYND